MSYAHFVGKEVVVDTDSQFLYIGVLYKTTKNHVILSKADVRNVNQTASTPDKYLMESVRNGVVPNRRQVMIVKNKVVSISLLSDIIIY